MCMTPKMPTQTAPVIPESVKRVAQDQRRTVASNNAAAAQSATATRKSGLAPLGQAPMANQQKSLLGV